MLTERLFHSENQPFFYQTWIREKIVKKDRKFLHATEKEILGLWIEKIIEIIVSNILKGKPYELSYC